jgi:5-hydroxyisourate hydrolase-like protein (transthyretin family)
MRTSMTRTIVGAAVAAAAVVALAGSAGATTTPPPAKAPTTLSIAERSGTIIQGQKNTVSGTLLAATKPVAKQIVLLDRVVGTKLVRANVQLTSKAGKVSFTVKPAVTTKYELRFLGSNTLAASHSGVVTTVVVVKTHTTLSIVEHSSTITLGQKNTVSGTLLAAGKPAAKQIVLLDRVVGTKLVRGNVQLTNSAGKVSFTVKPAVTTKYELVFPGSNTLAASHSGVVTTVVKK